MTPQGSSERIGILIVEDELVIALSASETLADLGYDVTGIAATPEAALRSAAQRRPDLVLMDIRLRDGRDGVAAALSLQTRFGVPVLFVTGQSDESTMQRAQAIRPVGCLIKPFSPRQLEEAVSDALGILNESG